MSSLKPDLHDLAARFARKALALDGKVNVTLGWFKRPKPRGHKH